MSIDVWVENLTTSDDQYRHYWSLLDSSEQDKALRFAQEVHRRFYTVSHGKLRRILASYSNISSNKITFATQAFGKPILVGNADIGIKFNMAHSGNLMIVAVGKNYEIGIDVEIWSNNVDYDSVANLCFSETERIFWNGLPANEKTEFFYRLWTRKESFVKATGLGLGVDVSQVTSSLVGTTRFLTIPNDYGLAEDWNLIDLDLGGGKSAALTAPKNSFSRIQFRKLQSVMFS